jgi:hypothetical protein
MNKFTKAAFLTGLYAVVLLAIYYVHMRFFRVNVVFYATLLDASLALLATSLWFFLPAFKAIGGLEKILLGLVWLLSGYAFAISVPTVVDRSLSFYILEKLAQRGGGIREDAFPDVFTKEYLVEHHLVAVRLTEQEESGTIEIVDGCVRLTEKGRRIAAISRFYRQNLLPRQRLLLGVYTDALTDPFRTSRTDVTYQCK